MSIKRYKAILNAHKILGKDMAERLSLKYSSYRSETRNKQRYYPKWLQGFLIGYDMGRTIHIDKHSTKAKRAKKLKQELKLKKEQDESESN